MSLNTAASSPSSPGRTRSGSPKSASRSFSASRLSSRIRFVWLRAIIQTAIPEPSRIRAENNSTHTKLIAILLSAACARASDGKIGTASNGKTPKTNRASSVIRNRLQPIIILTSAVSRERAQKTPGATRTCCYFVQSLTPERNRRRDFPIREIVPAAQCRGRLVSSRTAVFR